MNKKSFDKDKLDINTLLATMYNNMNPNIHNGIVLDGEKLGTTLTFDKQTDLKKKNIYVPNPFVKRWVRRPVHHLKHLLGEALCLMRYALHNQVSFMYFDYMCTLDGNKKTNPKKDIELFFKQEMPTNECLVGLTICRRNSKPKVNSDDVRANAFMKRISKKYGYKIRKTALCLQYNRTMYLGSWIITK